MTEMKGDFKRMEDDLGKTLYSCHYEIAELKSSMDK